MIQFENRPGWRQMRIHPLERKAFLEVEFARWIPVHDRLCDQTIDRHHRDLAADHHATV